MIGKDRVFPFDAHGARGDYVAEGYGGVSLECWRQVVGQTPILVARKRDRLGWTMPSCVCPADAVSSGENK